MAIIYNTQKKQAIKVVDQSEISYVLPNTTALGIFQQGVPEQAIIDNILPKLGDRPVMIDVGAHVGTYALSFARRSRTIQKVLAFEPQRATFNCLCAGIALNGLSIVQAYNLALSTSPGQATLRIISLDGGGSSIAELPTNTHPLATEHVVVDTLDNVCTRENILPEQVEFIKIDIEGSELAMLQGAKHILSARPKLLFEAWPNTWFDESRTVLLKYVSSLGYIITPIKDNPHMYFAFI